MKEIVPRNRSLRGMMAWFGVLCVSLLVNAALAHRMTRPAGQGIAESGANPAVVTSVKRATNGSAEAQAADASTDSRPFNWSQVESADYKKYIANLRAIGCPEQVIQDIIVTDLNQVFLPRAKQIWWPRKHEYWQKRSNVLGQANADQLKRLKALEKEKQAVLKELLGINYHDQEYAGLLFHQNRGIDRQLAYLPADKREVVRKVLSDTNLTDESELKDSPQGYQEARKELLERQLKALATVLSPQELEEYRMRNSIAATMLRNSLRYFDCSEDEFKSILKVQEDLQNGSNESMDVYAQHAAESAALKKVLGDERGAEYEKSTDLFYIWAKQASGRYGLSDDAAAQAWQIKRDTMAGAEAIRSQTDLAADERQRQLSELLQQTSAKLTEVLGTDGAEMARHGDGVWLQMLTDKNPK
jgi:hypothetical protein